MISLSVSLPQVKKSGEQPEISALATAVPCLKAFPPDAWTRTRTCWPDPVQPTLSKAVPWAMPDPARWVTVTWMNALLGDALQVTSSGTSTAAPRATSDAGDSTWTSRNSPPEKNATAGPAEANSASTPPAVRATTAAATLVRTLVLIRLPSLGGYGRCAGDSLPWVATDGVRETPFLGWLRTVCGRRRHGAPEGLRRPAASR